MSCGRKIIVIYALVLELSAIPVFQGFSVNKSFEVKMKPFEFKPITFFKEKWSPFGKYGVQKGIVKRDVLMETAPQVFPAPVFENAEEEKPAEEKELKEFASSLGLNLESIKPLESNVINVATFKSFKPAPGLNTNIIPDIQPVNNPPNSAESASSVQSVKPIFTPAQAIAPETAQPATVITKVTPILAKPINFVPPPPPPPQNPILTQSFILTPPPAAEPTKMVPLLTPPPASPAVDIPKVPFPEIPPTEGPLLRGSRKALYFGNIFLQLVSQFLTNARLQFSQPPPASPASN